MLGRKYIKSSLLYLFVVFLILSCLSVSGNDKDKDKDIDVFVITEPQAEEEVCEPPVEIIELEIIPEPEIEMVYYEGKLLNIFFHPVIALPEIAFNGSLKNHFLDWFITADEYKKILYELYKQDYVLIDINEFYEVTYEDDIKKIVEKKLLVPEGKKPMVLSIDDLSYYEYMKENGIVHKLVIDEKNDIAAWTDDGNDGEISYDMDVLTILEDFIKQYPDFSLRGAKGIIALTGFEGVLGYKTQQEDNPDYQEEIDKAVVVVNRLKELGWRFASHSFNHRNLRQITFKDFNDDVDTWDLEVRPIIGDTDLYVYPFGAGVEGYTDRHRILRERGFNVFFGVGPGFDYRVTSGYIFIDRRNIDGTYFKAFRNRRDKLFDIDKIMDSGLRYPKR